MLRLGLLTHNFPSHPERTTDAGGFVASLATMLQGSQYDVTVFCQSIGISNKAPIGIKLYQFPWSGEGYKLGHLRWTRWGDLRILTDFIRNGRKGVLRFIRDHGIEYCLALWAVPGGYFAHYAKRELGIPYTVWALGSDINQYYRFGLRGVIRRVLLEADHICADGPELARKVNKVVGDHRCIFLPSSRPLLYGQGQARTGRAGTHFLFVGRLEKVKGIDLLLRAFSELVKNETRATLEIIGTGSLKSEVADFVRRQHLEHRIMLRDSIPTDQLRQAYQGSDCLVIPSRSESLPLVFSEAMQYRLPVIATDVGDLRHFVEQYQAGVIVSPESMDDLQRGMESFLNSQIHWSEQKMQDAAKDLSLERSIAQLRTMIGVTK